MGEILYIKRFKDVFTKSTNRTEKCKKLRWISMPTEPGKGVLYLRQRGWQYSGVFDALCQLAGRTAAWGAFLNDQGKPYDIEDLTLFINGNIKLVQETVEMCMESKLGLIATASNIKDLPDDSVWFPPGCQFHPGEDQMKPNGHQMKLPGTHRQDKDIDITDSLSVSACAGGGAEHARIRAIFRRAGISSQVKIDRAIAAATGLTPAAAWWCVIRARQRAEEAGKSRRSVPGLILTIAQDGDWIDQEHPEPPASAWGEKVEEVRQAPLEPLSDAERLEGMKKLKQSLPASRQKPQKGAAS